MPLTGLTILVVEDEPLIALDISFILEDAGATVRGPYASISQAMQAIEETPPGELCDTAVLDYKLGRECCEPVARKLFDSDVPFVLHTASATGAQELAEELSVRIVEKPTIGTSLLDALQMSVGRP